MAKTYIRKSQRIYQQVYTAIAQRYSNQAIAPLFGDGVVNALKLSKHGLGALIKYDSEMSKIDVTNLKQTDLKRHNFYYEQIAKVVDKIERSVITQRPPRSVGQAGEYYSGNFFVFSTIKDYAESCLIENSKKQD